MIRFLPILLLAAFVACNDDDDSTETPTGPDTEGGVSLDTAVIDQLNAGIEEAIGLLFVGGGTVPGEGGGQIVVAGSTFTFEEYSPDGEFFLSDPLTMDLVSSPITVAGDLTYRTGDESGEIVVAMTIDATVDPPAYGGTIAIDGVSVDVAELQ
jgi:hypothetical protein